MKRRRKKKDNAPLIALGAGVLLFWLVRRQVDAAYAADSAANVYVPVTGPVQPILTQATPTFARPTPQLIGPSVIRVQ